jgi:hypothetical protein
MISKVLDKIANPAATVSIKFESFDTAEFADSATGEWKGNYLPVEVALNYINKFNHTTPSGDTSAESTFSESIPSAFKIDIEIIKPLDLEEIADDFKGIVTGSVTGGDEDAKPGYVMEEVEKLRDIIYAYNGDIHAPNFVKVSFGEIIFKGKCTSFNYTLKQFDRFGKSNRASLSLSFGEEKSEEAKDKENGNNSPDMTHYYVVAYGETLPIISNKIYGTTALYLELAKVNGLNSFRSLPVGTRLTLPPLIND